MSFIEGLNPEQRKAVETIHGPVMVVAGPGSGKTRVLTFRIANMIQSGISPYNILSLTFTNKAAREMKERIENVVGPKARTLAMGTFHSVFARILRTESEHLGYPSNFTIYDTDDSKNVVKKILKEYKLSDQAYKPNVVYNRISQAKNQLVDPAQYANDAFWVGDDQSSGRPQIHKVYAEYVKRCEQAAAMDFDDLLMKMYKLLSSNKEVLEKYRAKFQYILIDEFQDTNPAQYKIVKLLAASHRNICAVGDDAQSIYAFRGADIENILFFEKDFSELKTFKLEQNYRSTGAIVSAANHIIKKNTKQLAKTIWTDNEDGEKIQLIQTASDNEEGRIVADRIFEEQMRNHYSPKDFCILYRTNAQSRAYEESLRKLNIPYRIYGGLSFYARKEVKDVLAYLKAIANPNDEEALLRIVNYPTRGIGATTLEKCIFLARQHNVSLWVIFQNIQSSNLAARTKNKLSDFVKMILAMQAKAKTEDAYQVAVEICKLSGLLKDLHVDKTPEGVSRFENVESLLNSIQEFVNQEPESTDEDIALDKSLGSYLQQVSLLTDADNEDEEPNRVTLMTVHAAKGLEFPVVFVGGLEENLFPSMMASQSAIEVEEERRLFYVAVTRAKTKLYLTFANTRYRFGNLLYCEPSRFLSELDASQIDYIGAKPKAEPRRTPATPAFKKPGPSAAKTSFNKPKPSGSAFNKKPVLPKNPDFKAEPVEHIQKGAKVEHERFGFGEVVHVEGGMQGKVASVLFKEHGTRRIMLKFAKMRIVEDSLS